MASRPQYKVQQFIDKIPGSAGIVATIARRVGCSWHTARKYIDRHPTVKAAYDAECEAVLDAAESVVISKIVDEKDVQTAKWYLKMKGDERGYSQVRVLRLKHLLEIADMSDAELMRKNADLVGQITKTELEN